MYVSATRTDQRDVALHADGWSVAIGRWAGLAMGAFMAAWMLCLGYVYADAKRRAMRPVLWTLIAALFPHLFGFLLYFALRQPMSPRCTKCGQPVTLDQRFCSWCGTPGPVSGGGTPGGAGGFGMGAGGDGVRGVPGSGGNRKSAANRDKRTAKG